MRELQEKLQQDEILQRLKREGAFAQIPMLQDDGLIFLAQTVINRHAKKVFEIGSAQGYSAIALNRLADVEIWTIEREVTLFEIAQKNVNLAGLSDKIHVLFGDALEIQTDQMPTFDIIFIDAAKAQYQRFFQKYAPKLSQDGCIMTDNLAFHGLVETMAPYLTRNQLAIARKLKAFTTWLDNQTDFATTYHNIGDGMSLSQRTKG